MDILFDSLSIEWNNLIRLTPKIIAALALFIIIFIVGKLLGKAIAHVLTKYNFKPTHTGFFKGLMTWIFALIGIIIGLNILGLKTLATSLVAGGGITAVVLGFAFREIGENFLAGFFLAFSRPFDVGNLIQSGEFQGIVKSIEMRSTHIRTADGRDIFIPSSKIFNNALINFNRDGLRRLSFTIGIDYADDPNKARDLLLQTAKNKTEILKDPSPTTTISSFEANFVILEVTFWIDTFQKGIDILEIKNGLMENSRSTLSDNGFTFSSNVTTNLSLKGHDTIDINLIKTAGQN